MRKVFVVCVGLVGVLLAPVFGLEPEGASFTNSIGMEFVRIEPGEFQMGQLKTPLPAELLWIISSRRGGRMDTFSNGDFDEKPVHTVKISKPFYMGVCEVTNKQYELFRPDHKKLRGKDNGLSKQDDEAVINVNWYDATAFCRWLSDRQGLPCRLPTEAEWEYACRAGTGTNYYTGETLPVEFRKNARMTGWPGQVPLHVGKTPANRWGLYDMHGNVEEWCRDWYGPYNSGVQTDPVGYETGDFRVLRGGSHSTPIYFLRSANRMGAVPEDKHWLIGFRVVIGGPPAGEALGAPRRPLNQRYVIKNNPADVTQGPDPDKPYFNGPRKYVRIPKEAKGPLFSGHNHDPAIVECPNGDLLAVWYTCVSEKDRELGLAASRLRWGNKNWEPASTFFDTPDRNDHAPALWFDGKDKLYHFSGVSAGGSYGPLALVMRTSRDSGATWSSPRLICPEHTGGHQPSEPVFRMNDGAIALAVDGPDTLWMSRDEGLSWFNPGGDIPGIHVGATQAADGRIVAFSRSGNIEGKMPMSVSTDGGKTFTSTASEFGGIGGGQRLVLLRLRDDSLVFASFANGGITVTDSSGQHRQVRGLFAALSQDNGKNWPYKRLITDDGPPRTIECTDGGAITLSARSGEYRGYLAICQGLDGVIHLISSRNHYAFNSQWLKTPPPPVSHPPVRVKHVRETFSGPDKFDADDWHLYKGFTGGFNGKGQYAVDSHNHFYGLNRVVGSGSFEALFVVKNIHYNDYGKKTPPGVTLGFKDPFSGSMLVAVQADKLDEVSLSSPPRAAKVKFTWNEDSKRWRIFYGLDGDEPTTELPKSKAGLEHQTAVSESAAAFFLMSNGSMDIDYFEVEPLNIER